MKNFLKKILSFSLIVLTIVGAGVFAYEFSIHQNLKQRVGWIFETCEKIHFEHFDLDALQSSYRVNILEGEEKAKIQERLKVDINHAPQEELEQLPQIGPTLAQRLIKERERDFFKNLEDLKRVKGMGVKTLEKLKPVIKFCFDSDQKIPTTKKNK